MLIAYTLLRRQMRLMAERIKVEPLRMGFHSTSIAIIDVLRHAPLASAGTLPKRLASLFEQADLFVLPPDAKIAPFPESSNPVPSIPGKMPVSGN